MSFLLKKKISRAHFTVGKGTYFRLLIGNSDNGIFKLLSLVFIRWKKYRREESGFSKYSNGSPTSRCLKSPGWIFSPKRMGHRNFTKIYLFNSFIQQRFIKHLLYAKHWVYNDGKTNIAPSLKVLIYVYKQWCSEQQQQHTSKLKPKCSLNKIRKKQYSLISTPSPWTPSFTLCWSTQTPAIHQRHPYRSPPKSPKDAF